MQANPQRSLLTIALLAAFADGAKADRERDEIRRIADSLAQAGGDAVLLAGLYQDVLLQRVDLSGAVAALTDPAHRQLAYELALSVCDADGARGDAENRFLAELKAALGLADAQARAAERDADTIAELPLATAAGAPGAATARVDEAELDQTILQQAILTGALELLPQSWASVAIIPMQVRLVYRVGQAYGHTLDQGHIKEFIAATGVGLTSQYLEQFGRKLLGGLLGSVGGGVGRALGSAATGAAFSFATTYALGQLAKRHYAGGRQMNAALLRETFQQLLGSARQLQAQYLPQIEQQARQLDAGKIVAMIKRGPL